MENRPAVCRGKPHRSSPAASAIVRATSNALAGIASRKNTQKPTNGCSSASNTLQVRMSSQSISMKAGKVGRKNSADTRIAVSAKSMARAQYRMGPMVGCGGSGSRRWFDRRAGAPSQVSPSGIARPAARADSPHSLASRPITVSFSSTE